MRLTPRRDSRGASLTLWTVILAPVAALTASAAYALPRYFAAADAAQETAAGIAFVAHIQREAQPAGRLAGLPPCGDISDAACGEMWDRFVADLGSRGVDTRSVRGLYSDAAHTLPARGGTVPCAAPRGLGLASDAVAVTVVVDYAAESWAEANIWGGPIAVGARHAGAAHTDMSPGDRAATCLAIYDLEDPAARQFWDASPRHLLGR